MYCSVHRPVNTPGVSDNKGSCLQLVEYLSKESNDERPYFDTFFSQNLDFVSGNDVLPTEFNILNKKVTLSNASSAEKYAREVVSQTVALRNGYGLMEDL